MVPNEFFDFVKQLTTYRYIWHIHYSIPTLVLSIHYKQSWIIQANHSQSQPSHLQDHSRIQDRHRAFIQAYGEWQWTTQVGVEPTTSWAWVLCSDQTCFQIFFDLEICHWQGNLKLLNDECKFMNLLYFKVKIKFLMKCACIVTEYSEWYFYTNIVFIF